MGFDKANLGLGPSPATHELCDPGQVTLPLSLSFLSCKVEVNIEPVLMWKEGED